MERRIFIKIMGSSAIILAATGSGYGWVASRRPTKALAPWDTAGSDLFCDARVKALSYAILAPNPHNRQPWLVDLTTPDRAVLYCDLERLLKQTDPFDRQIVIGHGCFLELLDIAAREMGYSVHIQPFPEGYSDVELDKRPVAIIDFTVDAAARRDPLFSYILIRRSTKEKFDTTRLVEQQKVKAICSVATPDLSAGYTIETETVASLRDLAIRGHLVESSTPRTLKESVDLMRIGKTEIEANPDGIQLGGPLMDGLKLIGQISRAQLADMKSSAYQQGLDLYKNLISTAMGFVWIVTENNTRLEQIAAGRSWVRMNLKATEQGIALHPHSQVLQEFPEMAALYEELHRDLNVSSPRRVQMLGRIGYGPKVSPTPRWGVNTHII